VSFPRTVNYVEGERGKGPALLPQVARQQLSGWSPQS